MARKRLNVKFLVVLVSIAGCLLVGLAVAGWWYKDSPGRAVRRAQEAEERGDWRKAAEQWAKAARASNDPDYLLKAIDASMRRTSEPNGLELLKQINQNYIALLASDPTLMPALRGQMRLLAGDRAFAGSRPTASTREVRRLAGEVLKQEPNDSEAKTLRALATINLAQFTGEGVTAQDVEQAELELRSVAELAPGNGLAVVNLAQRMLGKAEEMRAAGDLDEMLEQWQETVRVLDEISQKHGQLPESPTLDQARLQWRLGQAYAMAARVKPLFDSAKLAASGTPAHQIDPSELARDPVTVDTAQRGHAHLSAARDALDKQRDGLEEDYREIRLSYADSLGAQANLEESEAEVRALLAERPWDSQVSATLAQMLQQQARLEDAILVVREARKQEAQELPQLSGHAGVNARVNRMLYKPFQGEVLLGRWETSRDEEQRKALVAEARQLYEEYEGQRKAIGYSPTSESTRLWAQIQIAEGDLAGGIQTLTSALRFTTEADSTLDRRERLKVLGLLVESNRRLGQTGAQRRYLEEMAQLAPGVSRIQRELAELYLAQGERGRAVQLIQSLVSQFPNDTGIQQLALQAMPREERIAAYQRLPESNYGEQQAKLGVAIRMGASEEILRLATTMREGLPADGRTPDQQQQYEALTLTVAQQLGLAGRKDEAIEMVRPLAEANNTAKAMLTQLEGGTDALIASLPEGVNKLLVESQVAELRGDPATALAKLEEAAVVAPDNDVVGNRLFSAYLARHLLDKAEELGQALKARGADQMDGGTYFVRLSLARGDTEAAARAAADLAKNFPQFAEAQALHGESLRQAKRPGEAVDAFRRALELAPSTPATLVGILTSLEDAGRFQEARPFIDAGLRLQPQNLTFRDADRIFQIRFGDPSQVIAVRQRAAQDRPQDAEAHYELGQTLMFAAAAATRVGEEIRANQYLTQAQEVFSTAASRFPTDVRMIEGLVRAAAQLGPEAMAAAEPIVQAGVVAPGAPLANDLAAVTAAADLLARRGNLAKAESVVRSAMSDPSLTRENKVALLLMLNELLVGQNRLDDSIAVLAGYEDVPTVLQRKIEVLARRVAQQPQDTGTYQAMRQASDAVVEDHTVPVGALPALAYAEMERGDLSRAVSLLDQALSRQANNSRSLLLRGAVEARREGGDMDRAAEWLEQANVIAPDDQDILRELGRVQRRRGRIEEAVAAMTRLTEVQPSSGPARLELLNLLLSLNPPRFAEANRQFRAAERAGQGGDPMLLMARAQMEQLRGRGSEGLPFAQRAIELAADNTELSPGQHAELLMAYLDLLLSEEQYQQVVAVTDPHVANDGGEWWILRARGQAQAELGQRDAAIATYRSAFTKAQPAAVDDAVLVDMSRNLGFEESYKLIKDRIERTDGKQPEPRDLLVASSLYAQAGQMDRAIGMLEDALKREADLTPQQKVSLDTQLGTLFLVTSPRRTDRAAEHLRRAAQMQPENVGVLNNLAYALTLQADGATGPDAVAVRQEALEMARRAYDLHIAASRRLDQEPVATVLDTYAWALALSGIATNDQPSKDEALRLLQEARGLAEDKNESLPEIYLHQSRLLSAMGNGEGAREAAETGLARLERRRSSTEPLEPHLEADLRAALMRARDEAATVQASSSGGS